jgi:hypothetical protein
VDRPVSTVRNWLRGFGQHAERLRVIGTVRYYELDAHTIDIVPAGCRRWGRVEALGLAARAAILRSGTFDHPWAAINVVTAGTLLGWPDRHRSPI